MRNRPEVAKVLGRWLHKGQAGSPLTLLRLARRGRDGVISQVDAWTREDALDLESFLNDLDGRCRPGCEYQLIAQFGGSSAVVDIEPGGEEEVDPVTTLAPVFRPSEMQVMPSRGDPGVHLVGANGKQLDVILALVSEVVTEARRTKQEAVEIRDRYQQQADQFFELQMKIAKEREQLLDFKAQREAAAQDRAMQREMKSQAFGMLMGLAPPVLGSVVAALVPQAKTAVEVGPLINALHDAIKQLDQESLFQIMDVFGSRLDPKTFQKMQIAVFNIAQSHQREKERAERAQNGQMSGAQSKDAPS